jgi:hypothetical protein
MASEYGEFSKEDRDAQQNRRAERLPIRTAEIEELRNLGYRVEMLTPYQFRVNGFFDLYPIHHRWHNTITGSRGEYHPFYLKGQIKRVINK